MMGPLTLGDLNVVEQGHVQASKPRSQWPKPSYPPSSLQHGHLWLVHQGHQDHHSPSRSDLDLFPVFQDARYPGTHASGDAVNKKRADKGRVENGRLLEVVS